MRQVARTAGARHAAVKRSVPIQRSCLEYTGVCTYCGQRQCTQISKELVKKYDANVAEAHQVIQSFTKAIKLHHIANRKMEACPHKKKLYVPTIVLFIVTPNGNTWQKSTCKQINIFFVQDLYESVH